MSTTEKSPLAGAVNQDVIRLNAQAVQALAQRRLADARAMLGQALALDPAYVPAWLNSAAVMRAQGDFAGAQEAVTGALRQQPLNYPALLMRASLFEAQMKPRQAAQAYNIALSQMPSFDSMDPGLQRASRHALDFHARSRREMDDFLRRQFAARRPAGASAPARRMSQFVDFLGGNRKPYWSCPTNFFYPGLLSIEFWDRDQFPFLDAMEAATDKVREELLGVLDQEAASSELEPYMQRPDDEPVEQFGELNHSRKWSAYHFAFYGKPYEKHRNACPVTAGLLDALPYPVIPNRSPAAMYSILEPHTHIPPHHGASNVRLLGHLPLVLPGNGRFRVGNSLREWRMGEAMIFDDTIEHEAWNDSDQMRTVLIFDIWHPQLTADEREFITEMMGALDSFNGAA
jgi:aspartyl/asparaginyl beta-hydroxylase (cupin superfamily)